MFVSDCLNQTELDIPQFETSGPMRFFVENWHNKYVGYQVKAF